MCPIAALQTSKSALQVLISTHVGDALSTGNKEFENIFQPKKIDTKPRTYNNPTFADVTINKNPDGSRIIYQHKYANKIPLFSKDCTFKQFRFRRHDLVWLTHTQPDLSFQGAIRAEETEQLFEHLNVAQLNRATISLSITVQQNSAKHQEFKKA